MKRLIIFLSIVLCVVFNTSAQTVKGSFMGAIGYNVAVPIGSFASDYISKASFYGGEVQGRYFIADNLSVGASFSWNKFYEKMPRTTYLTANGAVTATQFRFLRAFPIEATAHYYFGNSESQIRPYAGLGLGAISLRREVDVSDLAFIENSWNFIATPEIGALIGFGKYGNSGLILSVKYNYTTLNNEAISNLQYMGIQGGIYFGLGDE